VGCCRVSYRTGMTGLFTTSVFPDDPWALPAPQQRLQARRQLLELLPGAYLDANTYEDLRWVGHRRGSQRPRPRCPGCRRRLDEQFLQRYHDSLPLEDPLRRPVPCCGTEVALNTQLGWPWETGHARLVLQAMTRQRPPKAKVIRAAMGPALGCGVRVYQQTPAGPGQLPIPMTG
jgi:hypothetical protein